MIYDRENVAPRCSIYDVDTKERIQRVVRVDVGLGEVEAAVYPLEITASGEIVTKTLHYRSIHPIRGGRHLPCLFHCYGLLAKPTSDQRN